MTAPIRLYREQGHDRLAVVSVEPSWAHPGHSLIAVARGPNRRKLAPAHLYGPLPDTQIPAQLESVVAALRTEGFGAAPSAALTELASPSPRVRARAALNLAWRGDRRAVETLLALAAEPKEDIATIVGALGWLGDNRAVPLVRGEAARKLLSRRRAGGEALRNLGDTEGLAEVVARARERLPPTVASRLAEAEADGGPVSAVVEALQSTPARDQGLVLDSLYEIASPAAVEAVTLALPDFDLAKPFSWRYAKSVWKRAMLRFDLPTFGLLSHLVESVGRSAIAQRADLKSGYDGQLRSTLVFSVKTRAYVVRAAWRFLRRLAAWRPELYPPAAAEILVRYDESDAQLPRGDFGAFSRCYLLHRILWDAGDRYRLVSGSTRFRRRPGAPVNASRREEAYPELWDRHPAAFLRVLAGARLEPVDSFAATAVAERHRDVLAGASLDQLAALLSGRSEQAMELALAELERRFDPEKPVARLVAIALADRRATVWSRGLAWLERAAGRWPEDPEACLDLLSSGHDEAFPAVVECLGAALEAASASQRSALAALLLAALAAGEATAGAHDRLATLTHRCLRREVAGQASLDALVALLEGSAAAQWVGAEALALQPEAAASLPPATLLRLCRHPLAAVRGAGLELTRSALPGLAQPTRLLLGIADADYPDARRGAVELLRGLGLDDLDVDALFEIVDSTREELQELGRELLLGSLDRLSPQTLTLRLLEHPAPAMRGFALDLAERHLTRDGLAERATPAFLRAVLLDLRPRRPLKAKALQLLVEAGSQGVDEARAAVAILADVVRSRTQADADGAVAALAALRLAFPTVPSPVRLAERPT